MQGVKRKSVHCATPYDQMKCLYTIRIIIIHHMYSCVCVCKVIFFIQGVERQFFTNIFSCVIIHKSVQDVLGYKPFMVPQMPQPPTDVVLMLVMLKLAISGHARVEDYQGRMSE